MSFAATGHPATDDLALPTLVAGIVHSGAMAVWLGALAVTAVTGAGHHDEPGTAVRRLGVLSRLAAGAVLLVVASGIYLAWRTLGSPAALLTTAYGAALSTKLALVLALLAVAAWGRRALRRRNPEPAGSRGPVLLHVRTSVLLEVVLAVAVLVAVARLVSTAPPLVP